MSRITCLETLDAMKRFRDSVPSHQKVALVPTMGALHAGHLALVERAKALAPVVIVSIFVNPMQFGPHEDFEKYPRNLENDLAVLEPYHPLTVFAPTVLEMYPHGPSKTVITMPSMTMVMCGLARPGHFDGVATVVAKLFNITRPHLALFGQKDAQQLAIIKQLVEDLNFPIAIIAVPTVRETSGLAMSSRNQYLTPSQKEQAAFLYQGLYAAQVLFENGERRANQLIDKVKQVLQSQNIDPEYIALVDQRTLEPIEVIRDSPVLIALAARIGQARLIDNVVLVP